MPALKSDTQRFFGSHDPNRSRRALYPNLVRLFGYTGHVAGFGLWTSYSAWVVVGDRGYLRWSYRAFPSARGWILVSLDPPRYRSIYRTNGRPLEEGICRDICKGRTWKLYIRGEFSVILGDGSIIDVRNFGKLLMDKIIILSSTITRAWGNFVGGRGNCMFG